MYRLYTCFTWEDGTQYINFVCFFHKFSNFFVSLNNIVKMKLKILKWFHQTSFEE